MHYKAFLGVASGIIMVLATLPYIRDIVTKKSRPSRATWILWTIMLLIDVFIQKELGSGWAVMLTIGDVAATGMIALLSFRFGIGGMSTSDKVCYTLWLVAVACWLGFNKPLLALHFSVLADSIALVPTLIKTYNQPELESYNVFVGGAIAGLLACLAVERLSFGAILLPAYLGIANAAEAILIFTSHKRLDATNKKTSLLQ